MDNLSKARKAFVIGARETVRGFNLIGVPGRELSINDDVIEILENLLKEEYSLIILSASFTYEIEDQLIEIRKKSPTPIIIVSDVNMQVDKKQIEKQFRSFIGL